MVCNTSAIAVVIPHIIDGTGVIIIAGSSGYAGRILDDGEMIIYRSGFPKEKKRE
jgi:hypothetical protein